MIPLRASNLLQSELKKIVFLGNKDYMEREVMLVYFDCGFFLVLRFNLHAFSTNGLRDFYIVILLRFCVLCLFSVASAV